VRRREFDARYEEARNGSRGSCTGSITSILRKPSQALYDLAMLEPDDLAKWREIFEENSKKSAIKVGRMKLGSSVSGDQIYAVAIRDSGLWLTLWVRRSRKKEFFVFYPRPDGSNSHVSYHGATASAA
jgi:hypothetical protein